MTQKRKVRFIEPGTRTGRPFNAWISRWPLLGPLTLASWLDQRGYDAQVYNENISGPAEENEEAWEDICSADVVGISIMTPTAMRGYDLARKIRQGGSKATIAFGGAHASLLPDEAIRYGDVVVRGEGENIIEALAEGSVREGVHSPPPPADLDALPTLNHLLMRDFDKLLASRRRREFYELPVMTSRGCPYGCSYCCVTKVFGRKVRRQSVEKVMRDVEHYNRQGFRHLFFYDDNFLTDRRWAQQLLARLQPLEMRFNAQARVDFHWADRHRTQPDRELLEAVRRAGADVLYVGYETIEDDTADEWNKGYTGAGTLERRLSEDTQVLHDSGFWIHGMFILGPHHSHKTADRIVRFARANRLESLQVSILTPFPGTKLFDEMKDHLALNRFPQDWDYYDGAHCVYDNGKMSLQETQRLVLEAHKQFYRLDHSAMRRLRALLSGPGSLTDRLARIWDNVQAGRMVMREWRKEIAAFLEMVQGRGLLLQPGR